MHDLIIIGAGPAGLTAALYAQRAGHSVLLLEGASPGGQAVSTPHIENWPGTTVISGPDFALNLYEQVRHLGIEIQSVKATAIQDDDTHKTVVCGETPYPCRTVILASGLQRRRLNVPGETALGGRGISYCAICDGNFFKGKTVAVIGGGDSALEDALYLATLCPSVLLIHRRDNFKAQQYLIDRVGKTSRIKSMMNTSVLEINGNERVESLLLSTPQGTQTLPVSGAFIAIGLQPENTLFSPPLQLDEYGFVAAEEDCSTNVPGVFAAGDCRHKEFRQLITAAADGAIAAGKAGQILLQ